MAKFVMMSMVFTVVLLKSAAIPLPTALPTFHTVGDGMGWALPNEGDTAFLKTWVTTRQFVVGDKLTFNFDPNSHNVQEVVEKAYDTCDIADKANTIGTLITELANVTLDSPGKHYYICTKEGHCQKGMKLSILVSATPGAPTFPYNYRNPPTTPSPNSGSTTPLGSTSTPVSSSPAVSVGVLVPMMAVVMGFFF